MNLTSEARVRILRARVRASTPRQLAFLVNDTKRRLKTGTISQTMHDLILHEVTVNSKEVRKND